MRAFSKVVRLTGNETGNSRAAERLDHGRSRSSSWKNGVPSLLEPDDIHQLRQLRVLPGDQGAELVCRQEGRTGAEAKASLLELRARDRVLDDRLIGGDDLPGRPLG